MDLEYEGYLRQVSMLNNLKRKLKQVHSLLPKDQVKQMGLSLLRICRNLTQMEQLLGRA